MNRQSMVLCLSILAATLVAACGTNPFDDPLVLNTPSESVPVEDVSGVEDPDATDTDIDMPKEDVSEESDTTEPAIDTGSDVSVDAYVDPDDLDNDGDGYTAAVDCDDDNPNIHPDAIEICNKIDDDCNGQVDDNAGSKWYLDADADGYGNPNKSLDSCDGISFLISVGGDCYDGNPEIHPGAFERCDGIDNNCDDVVDGSDAVDQTAWFDDLDGDGYGSSESVHTACISQVDLQLVVDNNNDCDDQNDQVHPGAVEFCDEIDNNCNGQIDEGLLITSYLDVDGDGYGDPAESTAACLIPDGFVDNNTDCDDSEDGGNIHPAATELCDGVDNDCDGKIDETTPGMCDDQNSLTDDSCDTSHGECVNEDILVQFTCAVPSGYPNAFVCGTVIFFEDPFGAYSQKIEQTVGGFLELTAAEVCLNLAFSHTLHVNTYVMDPLDPFALWIGGKYTKVKVQSQQVDGIPGTETLFSGGVDYLYDLADFQVCQ